MSFISILRLLLVNLRYIIKRFFYDIYFIFKKKYKYKIIFIAGMPMSATTRVKNMCGLIPGYFTRYSPTPFEVAVNQNISKSTFRYCPSWSYTLFKTHLNPTKTNIDILKKNNVKKIIVTYRDLRDVVLSRYHRLLKFPKKKGEPHYLETEKQYSNVSKSDGINNSIEVVSKDFIKWIDGWMEYGKIDKDFVLFCKFEDLVDNPKKEFKKILNFYDISMNENLIDFIVEETKGNKKNMVENIKENKYLPWALATNFRSGKIGGWKEEFDSSNIKKFKELCGEALIKLKYEKNLNW